MDFLARAPPEFTHVPATTAGRSRDTHRGSRAPGEPGARRLVGLPGWDRRARGRDRDPLVPPPWIIDDPGS